MAEINPPAWLQAGSYPARTDRLSAVTSMLSYAGFSADEATPLRPRQGMRPSYQNYQLKARAAATPNMTVIVSGGVAFVDNHDINGYGTYVLINDGDKTVTIAAAGGAGQFRKDTIVCSVYDAETAGALNSWQIEVIQGPYAASAGATVRGSLPSNCVVIADVAVAPSQTSVTTGNLTDGRVYTSALGGVSAFQSNGLPNHPHPGQLMYAMDTDELWIGTLAGTSRVVTPDPPMMHVTGAPSLVTSPSTYSALAFNARISGSGGTTWSSGTNPSRITVPKAGTYSVAGRIIWPGTLSTADGRAEIRINGATGSSRFSTERGSGGSMTSVCAGYEVLAAGDYVEVWANQNSGSSVALLTQFGLHRVSSAVA